MKQVKTIVNINDILRESPDEIAQRMQRLHRENEDLRSKLAAAKNEMIKMFDQK